MQRSARTAAAALVLTLPLALSMVPPATAHCAPGSGSRILGLVSTCPYNEDLEVALQAASAAGGGKFAFVLVKDYTFHPNVVTIKSGGTVVFLYADTEAAQQHDPRSSGGCTNGADLLANPEACVPVKPSACFDERADAGGVDMSQLGDTYPLTLTYAPGTGLVQKSKGLLSGTPVLGEPPLAQAFRACPAGTGTNSPARTLIAYHCGNHGAAQTAIQTMRGTIVVVA